MRLLIAVLALTLSAGIVFAQGQAGQPVDAGQKAQAAWAALYAKAKAKNWTEVEAAATAYAEAYPTNSRVVEGSIVSSLANAAFQQGKDNSALLQQMYETKTFAPTIRAAGAYSLGEAAYRETGNIADRIAWRTKAAAVEGLEGNALSRQRLRLAMADRQLATVESAMAVMDATTIAYKDAWLALHYYTGLGGSDQVAASTAAQVLTSRVISPRYNRWADAGTVKVRGEEISAIEGLYRFVSPLALGHEAWSEFILKFRSCLQDLTEDNKPFFAQIKKAAEMVD